MGGFAGILTFSSTRLDVSAIQRASNILKTFGPDKEGSWKDQQSHFVHRLKRLTPEDLFEQQPLRAGGGRFVVMNVGRLDNRDSLATKLSLNPDKLKMLPDSKLIALAFEKWGAECVDHLLGDFAFAVQDTRERKIYLARDYRGHRPLFWLRQNGYFAFATTPQAFFAFPDVTQEIDKTRFAWFMARLPPGDDDGTLFRNVKRVVPGNILIADADGETSHQYFRFDRDHRIRFKNDSDYVERARELFDQAVECRLRSSGKIASHLSAGLDSTLVSEAASRNLARQGKNLTCYTAIPKQSFDGGIPKHRFGNEAEGAASVARLLGNVDHICIGGDGIDIFEDMSRITPFVSGGIGNPGHSWGFDIMRDAAAQGCRALLSGSIGNYTSSYPGTTRLPSLLRDMRFGEWFRELRKAKGNGLLSYKGGIRMSLGFMTPPVVWNAMEKLWFGWAPEPKQRFAMHPSLMRDSALLDQAVKVGVDLSFRPRTDSWTDRTTLIMGKDFGEAHTMAIGAFGIDVRDPFSDRRFVEYCLALPEEQFFKDGVSRRLARGMAARLPAAIREQQGRGLQSSDWLDRMKEQQDVIHDWLDRMENSTAVCDLLDVAALRDLANKLPHATESGNARVIGDFKIKLLMGISHGAFILDVYRNNRGPG